MAEVGELKMTLILDDAMSNAELAAAIEVAHEKHYGSSPNTEGEKLWLEQLETLLAIQRCRAAACRFQKLPNTPREEREHGQ